VVGLEDLLGENVHALHGALGVGICG
jgi:hypothetical protein